MKTITEPTSDQFANMKAEELLRSCANFQHYQVIGECLGYNPTIAADGNQLPLKDWNYDADDAGARKCLDRWTKSKQAAPEIVRQLSNAATPLWGSQRSYLDTLKDVAEHLNLGVLTGKTLADFEQTIMHRILEQALKKIDDLPEGKKAKFNEEFDQFLKQHGIELGTQSAIEYIKAAGLAGGGTLIGTQIAAGIILSNLGIYHGLLFALGVWAIPAGWLAAIAGVIFAPLMAAVLTYLLGQHNFRKTIPCIAVIATIRQEAMSVAEGKPGHNVA